jgi:HlyD family secretion protein
MNYDSRIEPEDDTAALSPFNPLGVADEEDQRSRRRLIIIAAAVAVMLIALWFFMHRSAGGDLSGDAAKQSPVVTVVSPGRIAIAGKITATGSLAARRELPVGSVGEGGQVVQVLVEPGQWVRQGQVLAVIDSSVQVQQQASQSAQIQVSQADARLAQANLDRALKLVDRGFISKADVDRLTATRDAANARVRVAGAQLGELQARVRRLNIVAPASGLVLERNVEPGQVVGSGSGVLFRLAKDGEMELLADLSEEDLAALSPGVSAQVVPVGTDKSFTGQVWQIAPVIDPKTRQGTARIALGYAPELRPGGFATAEILSGTINAPQLPESAILSDDKGSYVYVVGKDNKVARRSIKTGMVSEEGIAIVEGLTGSERVVLRAGGFLAPGETVNPKPAPQP